MLFRSGVHTQGRSDLDGDGWTDLPWFRRLQARPRVYWDNGGGKSVLATIGVMGERRRGGTMPGATLPDRSVRAENLDTTRVDAGVFGRFVLSGGHVLAVRASSATSRRDRSLGAVRERDRNQTWFAESSLTATRGRHTWVGGTAIQHETFTARDVARFSYDYRTIGAFGQDEIALARRLSISASGRVDHHNVFGTFASPKVSALVRADGGVTFRVSGGRGHIAPTPFTEETDVTGLTPKIGRAHV